MAEPNIDTDQLPLSTPANYATPGQIAATREYAKALLGQGQQPVQHWAQGMSNMVASLMGANELKKAGESELGTAKQGVLNLPTEGGGTETKAPAAGVDPKYAYAISQIESGGKYDLVGPATKSGDRAYGKYQVMGSNVPEWTQAATGKKMSAQEFLASPEAQEAVFNHRFGTYLGKYGNPQDAASAWFTGGPASTGAGKRDISGTSGRGYVDKFNALIGGQAGNAPPSPTNGQPLSFSGQPTGEGGPAPDAQAAITMALSGRAPAGGGAPGAPPPAQSLPNDPGTGQPTMNPAYMQHRIPVTTEQFRQVLLNPYLSPEVKNMVVIQYYMQHQPVEMTGTGGRYVMPGGGGAPPLFIPELLKGTLEGGSAKMPTYQTMEPGGQSIRTVPEKGGEAAPAAAPAGPTSGAPPNILAPIPGLAGKGEATPAATPAPANPLAGPIPTTAPPEPGAPQIPPAPQAGAPPAGAPTASATQAKPESFPNLLKFAPDEPAGPLGTPPPGIASPGGMAGLAAPPPEAKTQVAQAGIPPALKNLSDFGIQQDVKKQRLEEEAKETNKLTAPIQTSGNLARTGMPTLQAARGLVDDPNFISGFLAGPRLDLARLKAWALDNPTAARSTEVFEKLMSGGIVEDMKILLTGLGQVRNAEINLLTKATGNIYNTPAANRAVLDIMLRTHKQADEFARLQSAYNQGWRWDAQGNPQQSGIRGMDYGWFDTAAKWKDAHPLFSDNEIMHFNDVLDGRTPDSKGTQAHPIQRFSPTQVSRTYTEASTGFKPGSATLPPGIEPDKK